MPQADPEHVPNAQTLRPLDYAPRPPLAWFSRHKQRLIFLSLCIAIVGSIWRYWQPLKHRVLWLYWSRQAAAHVMPAQAIDLIVDGPVQAKQLAAVNPDYIFPTPKGSTMGQWATYIPTTYRRLFQYDSRLNMTYEDGDAVAFMGMLRRPDGTPRLVIVTGGTGITRLLLKSTRALVLSLPGFFDPLPPTTTAHIGWGWGYSGGSPTPTRLLSGIGDPHDPSHIVFEFVAGPRGSDFNTNNTLPWVVSATGIIDAHLQNDDSLTFELRSYSRDDPNLYLHPTTMPANGQQQPIKMPRPPVPPVGLSIPKPSSLPGDPSMTTEERMRLRRERGN